MKSYLSLIPISARMHRRQNRMTLLCIVFAVFLVTAIVSMADLMVRCETEHARDIHGDWQIAISGLSDTEATAIRQRDDVVSASWYAATSLDDTGYTIEGKPLVLAGVQTPFMQSIMHYFPANAQLGPDDAILTPNARTLLGLREGDRVTVETASTSRSFTVVGFRSDESRYANANGSGETTALPVKGDQIGIFLDIDTFRTLTEQQAPETFYVRFADGTHLRSAIDDIQQRFDLSEADIVENTVLMGLSGLSANPMFTNLYPLVAILFVLVLLAGVLMITASLNSSVQQRTQAFGMMRCLGMSRAQVLRFVHLEALNWCKTAIPVGALLGVGLSWLLSAILHYGVGGEFADFPLFSLSPFGIACGAVLGLLTVLLAAARPAWRASKVSPLVACQEEAVVLSRKDKRAHLAFGSVETALGVAHAAGAKKNLVLMGASFGLSIVLFLCFSVLVTLLGCLLPTSSSAPDVSIQPKVDTETIDHTLCERLEEISGVRHAYGRMAAFDLPASFSVPAEQNTVSLISYDTLQLKWLEDDDMLQKGSDWKRLQTDENAVLAIWDVQNPLHIGDTVTVAGQTLTVAGCLDHSPFTNSGQTNGAIDLICSEATFSALTGKNDYAIIDLQLEEGATDDTLEAITTLAGASLDVIDRRDEGDRNTFWAFSLFIYGFLAIIALIGVFNITNSIALSVAARTRQYGVLRAIGLSGPALKKMIAAEAITYTLLGTVIGCGVGIPLSRFLFARLVTSHFPYETWSMPWSNLMLIVVFAACATAIAVRGPSHRLLSRSVTETISEL